MTFTARHAKLLVAGLAAVGLFALAAVQFTGNDVGAQDGDFEIVASTSTIPANDGTANVTVSVDPLDSGVAAVEGIVTWDANSLEATGCTTLVALGACNINDAGQMRFAAVLADGFAEEDIFEIAMQAQGADGSFPLDVAITAAYDDSTDTVVGTGVDGGVNVGGVIGDLDCDNTVSINDARFASLGSVQLRTPAQDCPLTEPNTYYEPTSDVDGDGILTPNDARQLTLCVTGLNSCDF